MTEQELAEILKYSSPTALYIVTWNNVLEKIICPFKVLVNQSVGSLMKGEIVLVEKVKVTIKLTTVFIVQGRAFYYYHFEILDPK